LRSIGNWCCGDRDLIKCNRCLPSGWFQGPVAGIVAQAVSHTAENKGAMMMRRAAAKKSKFCVAILTPFANLAGPAVD
jgi:hypothetical protein